jgi:hypothetical protein
MQNEGENYLAAVDADADTEIDAKHSSLPLNRVIETMEKSATATSIIILCCFGFPRRHRAGVFGRRVSGRFSLRVT